MAEAANFKIVEEIGSSFRIPLLGFKVPIPHWPALSEHIFYILKKKGEMEHFLTVGRPFNENYRSKEFRIKADLY